MIRKPTSEEDKTFRRLVERVTTHGPFEVKATFREARTQRARFYTWRAALEIDDPIRYAAYSIVCRIAGPGLRFDFGSNPSARIAAALEAPSAA